jgi:hypothetical protein
MFMRTLFLLALFVPAMLMGQTVCSAESRARLDLTLQLLAQFSDSTTSLDEWVQKIGLAYLNTPYVEKTLEVEGDEPLVINLTGLDCTTYLESVVTLARLSQQGRFTFEDYQKELEFLRYRNGRRNHYPSRLHYFSDWIYENQQKGILRDITAEIGGIPYQNRPGFMSANPQYYPQLAKKEFVAQIKRQEDSIATRLYHYIPKSRVQALEKGIKPGDLIAITISMQNLDIAHVGFAVEQAGRIHLLHASSKSKKVEVSALPLSDYLQGNKSQSGIMVCRLVEAPH